MEPSTDVAAAAADFQKLIRHGNCAESLQDLGTLLRNADTRSNPEIKALLPAVLALFPQHPGKVIRVLVNYVADNVANRYDVLEEDGFWSQALQMSPADHVHDLSLLMILLNQYLRSVEENDLLAFVEKLCARGCQKWVTEYYRQLLRELQEVHSLEEVDFERPLEFVKEVSRLMPEQVDAREYMSGYERFAAMSLKVKDSNGESGENVAPGDGTACGSVGEFADIDSLNDILIAYSEILYNVTNVQDSNVHSLGALVELLSIPIPLKLPQYLNIRRNLFAACGNVSSYPAYKNDDDIPANIHRIAATTDPYVISACAISLGNCVSSTELQERFLKMHNGNGAICRTLQKVLQTTFMDVIQFQAFHLFNNVLTTELAREIVAANNSVHLQRQTKVIADNCSYYKDIATLYLKFLRKLTTLGFQSLPPIDFLPYSEAYEYLLPVEDAAEVQYLVLQILCNEHTARVADFKKELVEKVLKADSAVSSGLLLLKIKTLAIFLRTHTPAQLYELYASELGDYITLLGSFVALLASASSEGAENTAEAGVVANNAKFIAISIKGHVEDLHAYKNEYEEQVVAITDSCMTLLKASKN